MKQPAPKMSPINLGLRFLLEVAVLISSAIWGASHEYYPLLLGILTPLLLAALWGIFAVRDDPSRSGKTIINTKGWLRLLLELSFFAFGSWTLVDLGYPNISLGFSILFLVHYLISYRRVIWLWQA